MTSPATEPEQEHQPATEPNPQHRPGSENTPEPDTGHATPTVGPREEPDSPDAASAGAPDRLWTAIGQARFSPPALRTLAWRRVSRAWATEHAAASADRDAEESNACRLPPDEHVRMPALWITELYTPTTVANLIKGVRKLTAPLPKLTAFDDIEQWVREQRRRGEAGAWRTVPTIVSRDSEYLPGTCLRDRLPAGVTSIDLTLHTVTTSVTAVVACFGLGAEASGSLEKILNQDVSSRVVRQANKLYSTTDPYWQKLRAVEDRRAGVRSEAEAWLADRIPGFFHAGSGQLPTIELLLTDHHRPWQSEPAGTQRARWLDLLDLEGWTGHWQGQNIAAMRLRERAIIREGRDIRHLTTLAALRSELPTFPGYGGSELDGSLHLLQEPVGALSVRWALSALVREVDEQLSALTDRAATASMGFGAARKLGRIHRDVIRIGLDGQVVINDVTRAAGDQRWWEYNVPDFTFVPPPGISPGNAEAQASETTLLSELRKNQRHDGERLTETEADLRELLGVGADLRAASLNLSLQWWVAILTVITLVVTLGPVIDHHGTSPPPTPSRSATPTRSP